MTDTIYDMLTSKKFIATLVALLLHVFARWGLSMDIDTATLLISPLYLYVLGQAITDHGKSAAVVAATTTTVTQATAAPSPAVVETKSVTPS